MEALLIPKRMFSLNLKRNSVVTLRVSTIFPKKCQLAFTLTVFLLFLFSLPGSM